MPSPLLTLACLAAGACLLTLDAGCAGAPATAPASHAATPRSTSTRVGPERGPSSSASAAPGRPVVAPAAVDRDLQDVAGRYLAARENAVSYTHPTPRSWLADVRAVMASAGWQRLAASLGNDGGFPAATARARRWSVRIIAVCRDNPDAGPASSTQAVLTCAVTDRTVDAAGRPVPARDLPGMWPYQGPQSPALLALRRVNGRWLVDADETGRAS